MQQTIDLNNPHRRVGQGSNPKVISYTILHYGIAYLPYAIQSIYSHVDTINILYTPKPSHGHSTDLQPPESREDLQRAAFSFNPDKKIKWFDYQGQPYEGAHRDSAVEICRSQGADIVLVVDSDEVWSSLTLDLAIRKVWQENKARNWLINFTHLWRSFNYCCKDEGWPVRLLDLRHNDKSVEYVPREYGEIYHFGYAISDALMSYKLSIHGHKNELRESWYQDKWLNWEQGIGDVHPTNDKDFWTPVEFDKNKLPELMCNHPFWSKERIE